MDWKSNILLPLWAEIWLNDITAKQINIEHQTELTIDRSIEVFLPSLCADCDAHHVRLNSSEQLSNEIDVHEIQQQQQQLLNYVESFQFGQYSQSRIESFQTLK